VAQIVDLTMGEIGEETEELEIVAPGEEVGILPRARRAPRRITVPRGRQFKIRRTIVTTVPKGTMLITPQGHRFTATRAKTRVRVPAGAKVTVPEVKPEISPWVLLPLLFLLGGKYGSYDRD